jgi:putative aldouronate transport system substrate-binding protein
MKLKKIIALLLASAMSVSILAACGGNTNTPTTEAPPADTSVSVAPADTTPEAPTDNKSEGQLLAEEYGLPYTPLSEADPISFTYFIRDGGTAPAADNPVIAIIEAITNTKIEFEHLVGDLETKISVMLASGDWNDMAYFGGEARPFVDSGLALPLTDLIEQYGPNLRAHYDPWWELMKHSDGEIYIAEIYSTPVGTQYINEHWGTAFWMQKAVLDHFGRAPANLDEYFDFIREYKELNPTIDGAPTMGYEILTEGWRRFCIDNPPMFMAGFGNWGPAAPADQRNFNSVSTAGDRWTVDWNKPFYQKLNDEYQLGTINAETLTRTYDEYLALLAQGVVLGLSDQLWNFNSGLDPLRAEGRHERTFLPLDFTYDGVTPMYLDSRQFTGNNGIIVNKDIANPERLIQYWDYLIQEDVQRLLAWGIEGEHWYYNDQGQIERPQEQRELQVEQRYQFDKMGQFLYDRMPKMQGSYADGNATTPGEQPAEYFAGLTDYDKALFAKLGIQNQTGLMRSVPAEWPAYYPYWSMTWEDGSAAGLANQRLEDVRKRYLAQLVICPAGDFDSLWNEYVSEVHNVDSQPLYDVIEAISQERLDASRN